MKKIKRYLSSGPFGRIGIVFTKEQELKIKELAKKKRGSNGRCCKGCDRNKSGYCILVGALIFSYAICDKYENLGDKKE